ncbi:MAG: aspartyl protease family protein [Pseudomonadota bacterium]
MKQRGTTGYILACLILITSCQSLSPGAAYNPLTNMVAVPLTRLPSLHHILTVEIQNVPGTFLVDTGANRTVVRDNRLQHFNIERADAHGQSRLIILEDVDRARVHHINSLSVSGITFPLTEVLSMNVDHLLDPIEDASGLSIDGILGMDALLSLGTLIELRTDTLYVEPVS